MYAFRLKKSWEGCGAAIVNKQFFSSAQARESCSGFSKAVFTSVKKSIFIIYYLVNSVSKIPLRGLILCVLVFVGAML